MVYYTKYRVPMVIISVMQFIGALGTELVNIFLICQQNSVRDVIMNFIALGVIAEIDDIYARTFYSSKIKNDIEGGIKLIINDKEPARSEYTNPWRPTTIVHGITRTFYECYYYYFMPFSVIAITYFLDL